MMQPVSVEKQPVCVMQPWSMVIPPVMVTQPVSMVLSGAFCVHVDVAVAYVLCLDYLSSDIKYVSWVMHILVASIGSFHWLIF